MSTLIRTFSCPSELWKELLGFKEEHPEFNFSGWIQKNIKDMLKRNETIDCPYFKDGYCQTDSSINECTLLKYGYCNLRR